MKLESVACNNCGAPLDVPEGANYVTCTHCNARLAVRRTEGARFTEVLDDLREQVAKLTRQNELEALDRQWDRDRMQFMITDKHGRSHLPVKGMMAVSGVVVVAIGLIWTIIAFGITSGSPFGFARVFPLFGILFMGFGAYACYMGYQKAESYERAHREYQHKRRELEREEREEREERDQGELD
jgi:LSD1 subclass zinc finger protein